MVEYKIIEGEPVTCQKWLNQWRHQYHLNILSMSSNTPEGDVTWVVILLTREEKTPSELKQ